MRVFVTGTGRCGSVSFAKSCQYITNYTSSHESRNHNLIYPDNHIEVNPMLRTALGVLIDKYPDALYVHLIRDRAACVPSLAALSHGQTMAAFFRLHRRMMPDNRIAQAERYYDWNNANIAQQIRHTKKGMTFTLENRFDLWPLFWRAIQAEGNYQVSLDLWKIPHNTRRQRGVT